MLPRDLFRKFLPSATSVRQNRLVGMFGSLLRHPNLWHLNRDSVAGAVAIGLFAGLVPGPLQMLMALLLAVPLRRNLPVALLMTLYTNPFTIVPLYLLAYGYGGLLLGGSHGEAKIEPFDMDWGHFLDSMARMLDWGLALGKPLLVGLVALGLTLAALGYVAVQVGWRAYVVLAWRARQRKRQQE
ncbi:MAG TPA: DUF2062 domain-containing protein [Burkholderiales bacterium]|jgi:uncharacterized protein|nr:DUF2062 domain-containing protein [Burkholderiales bacterium]